LTDQPEGWKTGRFLRLTIEQEFPMCFDGEPAAVFEAVDRIARSEKRCCECGVIIGRGEQYRDNRGMWDGEWQNFPQCMPCAEIVERIVQYEIEMGCIEGVSPPFGEALSAWHDIQREQNYFHFRGPLT
jgi:hypothetical protein